MARNVTDRVIVITGASSGIGAATAIACARAGMDVVLNARRADRLESVADRVRGEGRRAHTVVGDVTDPQVTEAMLDAAWTGLGRLDVVFANAGYSISRPVLEKSDEDFRRMFDVNFFASVDLLRAAATQLLAAGRPGHLLMCSSCLSKFALPNLAAYSATKAAQNAVCSSMRLELESAGIDVSSVHPITTRTEFFDVQAELSGDPDRAGLPEHAPRFLVQSPERVARAVVSCLRRPRPEVWTSTLVRTMAGVMTIFPRFGDWALRRQMRTELKRPSVPRG